VRQLPAAANASTSTRISLDGVLLSDNIIALVDDHRPHRVAISIQRAQPLAPEPAAGGKQPASAAT